MQRIEKRIEKFSPPGNNFFRSFENIPPSETERRKVPFRSASTDFIVDWQMNTRPANERKIS